MNAVELGDALARVNAGLNTASFVLLVTGYVQIKKKRPRVHETCMKLAFLSSALFLVGYLTRYAITGAHHLAGSGAVKVVYYTILFSHMILAAATVPLVLRTLYLARKGRFADHRRIARWTFPIWTYVSITGVIVYVMLYHAVGTVESHATAGGEAPGASSPPGGRLGASFPPGGWLGASFPPGGWLGASFPPGGWLGAGVARLTEPASAPSLPRP